MKTKKPNILAVDDHPLILKGLGDFLKEDESYNKIYLAENGKEAIDIIKSNQIDIVLLDLNMPILNGFETLKIISRKFTYIKVIIVTFDKSIEAIRKTLADGAMGYILKELALNELKDAIGKVLEGNIYYNKEVSDSLLIDYRKRLEEERNQFTEREEEVLRLICDGLSSKEISERLGVSPRTIEKHKSQLLIKTNSANTILLVRYALENKLI